MRTLLDREITARVTQFIILSVFSLLLLFPILWSLTTSFKNLDEIYSWPPTLIPKEFSLSGYQFSILKASVPTYLLNSLIYSASVTLLVLVTATITIYGLTFYPYKGSDKVFLAFFLTRTIPPQALWIPAIVMLSQVGLLNSRLSVILFGVILVYPLAVWMFKGIFDSFPREVIDSATIDGCSRLGALVRVVIPICAPAVAAVAIVSFLWNWNDFMFPYLVLNDKALYPITVGVFTLLGDEMAMWNALAATQMLAVAPGLVFFVIAQKYITKGLVSGAVKG